MVNHFKTPLQNTMKFTATLIAVAAASKLNTKLQLNALEEEQYTHEELVEYCRGDEVDAEHAGECADLLAGLGPETTVEGSDVSSDETSDEGSDVGSLRISEVEAFVSYCVEGVDIAESDLELCAKVEYCLENEDATTCQLGSGSDETSELTLAQLTSEETSDETSEETSEETSALSLAQLTSASGETSDEAGLTSDDESDSESIGDIGTDTALTN